MILGQSPIPGGRAGRWIIRQPGPQVDEFFQPAAINSAKVRPGEFRQHRQEEQGPQPSDARYSLAARSPRIDETVPGSVTTEW